MTRVKRLNWNRLFQFRMKAVLHFVSHDDKLAGQYFSAERRTHEIFLISQCILIEHSRVCSGHRWMKEEEEKTIVITGLGSVVACHFVRSTEG